MTHAIRPEMLNDTTSTQAVWLIDGYQPTPAAIGVFAAANAGSTPYPMVPYQGLLHSALGAELGDFMQGKESAEQAIEVLGLTGKCRPEDIREIFARLGAEMKSESTREENKQGGWSKTQV